MQLHYLLVVVVSDVIHDRCNICYYTSSKISNIRTEPCFFELNRTKLILHRIRIFFLTKLNRNKSVQHIPSHTAWARVVLKMRCC